MITRQELEKMVEDSVNDRFPTNTESARVNQLHIINCAVFKLGAAFVMDKLMPQLKARMELLAEFDDRIGELQKELTAANERIKELEAMLTPPERGEE